MRMTRRQFLNCTAAAASQGLSRDLRPLSRRRSSTAVILDLQQQCRLRESVAGYESALAGLGARPVTADGLVRSDAPCLAMVVPAALEIPPAALRSIRICLRAGGTVILESGAGYATEPDCLAHRTGLQECFAIRIDKPVDLWSPRARPRAVPYVEYTWPRAAQLRDFSRAVPVGAARRSGGEIIGHVNGLPVALKRDSGRGTLIFLGSPVGPALWAGDAE